MLLGRSPALTGSEIPSRISKIISVLPCIKWAFPLQFHHSSIFMRIKVKSWICGKNAKTIGDSFTIMLSNNISLSQAWTGTTQHDPSMWSVNLQCRRIHFSLEFKYLKMTVKPWPVGTPVLPQQWLSETCSPSPGSNFLIGSDQEC